MHKFSQISMTENILLALIFVSWPALIDVYSASGCAVITKLHGPLLCVSLVLSE